MALLLLFISSVYVDTEVAPSTAVVVVVDMSTLNERSCAFVQFATDVRTRVA